MRASLECLKALDTWLQHQRPDFYAELRPGASEAELGDLEAQLSQTLPEAFKDLLRWRNGQHDKAYASFHDNRMLMSIEDILSTWQMLQELSPEWDAETPNWWRSAWIPFMSNGGGAYLCLDLEGTFTGQPGQLIQFWHDDADRSVEYPDFDTYLAALSGSMPATQWKTDEEFWEINQLPEGYPKSFKA